MDTWLFAKTYISMYVKVYLQIQDLADIWYLAQIDCKLDFDCVHWSRSIASDDERSTYQQNQESIILSQCDSLWISIPPFKVQCPPLKWWLITWQSYHNKAKLSPESHTTRRRDATSYPLAPLSYCRIKSIISLYLLQYRRTSPLISCAVIVRKPHPHVASLDIQEVSYQRLLAD